MQGSLARFRLVSSASMLIVAAAIVGCGSPGRPPAPSSTGGSPSVGGSSSAGNGGGEGGGNGNGGGQGSGGARSEGGGSGSGGAASTGGSSAAGGVATGGKVGSGGAATNGGAGAGGGGAAGAGSGGNSNGGATTISGGATGSGGKLGSGGSNATGGSSAAGGAAGGSTGTAGSRPCDIYEAAGTPCVAAHSTVRALYGAYSGALYQVRNGSNVKDIPATADGYADIAVQNAFCSSGTCTIAIIYDQSPNKNHLAKTPDTLWLKNSKEASATNAQAKISVSGHTAYGVRINNSADNVGYRNNSTKGVAVNDDPESMYMVLADASFFSGTCCFDYGNVETTGSDLGSATMEALYWGNSTQFQKGGAGNGPWFAADLENGMFECDTASAVCTTNTSIPSNWAFVTGFLKGPSGNSMAIKAGNGQSGTLETKFSGKRPPGYTPMKKQGAIVLGTGGDGSNYGRGNFIEGAMTKGCPPDSVDDQIQANIVAAGYGK